MSKTNAIKNIVALLSFCILFSSNAFSDDRIIVFYNGNEVEFENTLIMENGKIFAPLDIVVKVFFKGNALSISHGLVVKNGKIYVPLRYTLEQNGAKVDWDEKLKTVNIMDIGDNVETNINETYIINSSLEKVYVSEDGTELIKYYLEYPVVYNCDGAEGINIFFQELSDSFIKKSSSEYLDEIIDFKESDLYNTNFGPYLFNKSFSVTYNDDSCLSVLVTDVEDTKGAHPMTYKYGFNFSTKTGNKITPWEFLNMTEDMFKNKVKEEFIYTINKEPEQFFPNALELLVDSLNKAEYYFTNEGVVCILPLYSIAPYAGGFKEVTIKN